MKQLARVTALILVVIGLLTVALGLYLGSRAFFQPAPFLPGLFGSPEVEGMLPPLRLLVGGIVLLNGLMTAALGEGLWLIASIAASSQKSGEHLAAWMGKGSLHIP